MQTYLESDHHALLLFEVGKFGWVIARVCDNSLCEKFKLGKIPETVKYALWQFMSVVWRSGLFTKGRPREVVVLAALKVLFGPRLPVEDLIVRAERLFNRRITPRQVENALMDLIAIRRYHKNARHRKTTLSNEDKKLLVEITSICRSVSIV